jgi:hypothetical protein
LWTSRQHPQVPLQTVRPWNLAQRTHHGRGRATTRPGFLKPLVGSAPQQHPQTLPSPWTEATRRDEQCSLRWEGSTPNHPAALRLGMQMGFNPPWQLCCHIHDHMSGFKTNQARSIRDTPLGRKFSAILNWTVPEWRGTNTTWHHVYV